MANGNTPGFHPDVPRVPDLNEKPRCATCHFYHWKAPMMIGGGQCKWAPPPALVRLYAMLQQEPATRIDYGSAFEELPDAMKKGACSAYKPKQDA